MVVSPARRVVGRLTVPGDKSISHRALLLSALADGPSRLTNLGPGNDCRSTAACLEQMGIRFERNPDKAGDVVVRGTGLGGLVRPADTLDAENSGTTTRLLLGVLAGHPWSARITGDASLQRRPMRRVMEPLTLMGARLEACDGRLPIMVHGGVLHGIEYALPVASAQVKSSVMLAALHAEGVTTIHEPAATRNHTELALAQFGVTVEVVGERAVRLAGGQRLSPVRFHIPGDPSSAAFWAVAAAALPGSDVIIDDVCLNPTRLGFLDVLRRAGATVEIDAHDSRGEPVGTMRIRHETLRPVTIAPHEVPGLIDELPVLAALATFGGGLSVSGAAELRVKESDRIAELVRGLRALGGTAEERPDGFTIDGQRRLQGGVADAAGDHRLAMAFAIAALGAEAPSRVLGAEAVAVSYPGFFVTLEDLRR
jgi:3-phosphoshikimate 1-carboxyvinyltransferase